MLTYVQANGVAVSYNLVGEAWIGYLTRKSMPLSKGNMH